MRAAYYNTWPSVSSCRRRLPQSTSCTAISLSIATDVAVAAGWPRIISTRSLRIEAYAMRNYARRSATSTPPGRTHHAPSLRPMTQPLLSGSIQSPSGASAKHIATSPKSPESKSTLSFQHLRSVLPRQIPDGCRKSTDLAPCHEPPRRATMCLLPVGQTCPRGAIPTNPHSLSLRMVS